MRRTSLLLVGLCLLIACRGADHTASGAIGGPQAADFSGTWIVQLTIFQDDCGFCTSGTPITDESLAVLQAQDSLAASLRGSGLKVELAGSITGSVASLASDGTLYVNSWYFIHSLTTASLSLSNGALSGVLSVELVDLGPCCALCCGDGQCLCTKDKLCRANLPYCKMTFVASGNRIP